MIPSNQQYNKWASLGRRVAVAMQSGERQEPERHIPVDGQIRGYLRWYGNLTRITGYWPLAEAIAYALEDNKFKKPKLRWLAEQFSHEWDSTPDAVIEEMEAAAWIAVDSRPDFALLVMGGATQVDFLLQFIQASMRWLNQFCLSLRHPLWQEQEAFWVKKRQWPQKVRRDAAYISAEDYLIVSELSRGRSRKELAQRLDCTVKQLTAQYQQILERAQLIVSKSDDIHFTIGRENWSIVDYLNSMGMSPYTDGYTVLRSAISLAQEQPGLLNNMTEQFYPALGEKTNKAPGTMNRKVRNAISSLLKNPNCAEFLQFAGFTEKDINLSKKFFEAFLKYMDQ